MLPKWWFQTSHLNYWQMCHWLDQRGTGCSAPVCVYNTNAYSRYFQSIACVTIHISQIKNSAKCLGHWCPVGGRMCHLPPMTCVSWPMVFIESCFLSVCTLTREDGWLTSSDIMSMACVTWLPVVFVVEFWHLYRITDGRSANTYVRNECVTYSCLITSFQWQVTGGWRIYSRMQISSSTSS